MTPEETLQAYRQRIDALDESIAQLLIERIGVIGEVAALKRQHWPKACHIRPGREGEMHRALLARFTGTAFPPLTALAMWRQLIGGSTQLESPLVATVIVPDHRFLAREYFGWQIPVSIAPDFNAALERMANGESNLLIIPSPEVSDWWKQGERLSRMGLSLFASLPLVAHNLPANVVPAVAMAAVAPEASGDDVSYYVRDGRLEKFNGFIADRDGIFLGAHPRAITLNRGDHG